MYNKTAILISPVFLAYFIFFAAQFTIAGTAHYEYDDLHRLTRVEYADLSIVEYTYDELGNRLSRSVTIAIILNAIPSEGGTVTGGGSYSQGDSVIISAEANQGYSFENWTEDDQEISTNNEYTFSAEVSRTLTANFTGVSGAGSIRVTIEPPDALNDGARWRRTGTVAWYESGDTETGIPAGDYTVEFLETSGWVAPASQEVTVTEEQTASLTGVYEPAFDDGDGTVDAPYQVSTPDQLTRLGSHLDSHFKLSADIDLAGYTWEPIGSETDPFTGGFDGSGYTITNMVINNNSAGYAGLFGYTDGAVIANTGIENVDILAGSHVGALAGYARNTTILQCYATGFVSGQDNVGGLVGALVADTESLISDSYADCNVSGNDAVGGLVGYLGSSASIINAYAVGSVTNGSNPGGLMGVNEDGTHDNVTNSFWNTDVGPASSQGGTGKTTAEMMQQDTFTDWDFDATWAIDEGKTYPYLQWQPAPEPFVDGHPKLVAWGTSLVADFGDRGLHRYDGGTWQWLNNWGHVNIMLEWGERLVVDFGQGRGIHFHNGTSWQWLTSWDDASNMAVWGDKLAVDFGAGRGIHVHDGTSWQWISNWDDANRMTAWGADMLVDFGAGRGMYTHDGSSWSWLANWDDANAMTVWGNNLAVDFGAGRGMYTHNGSSWSWLANWDDANRMLVWGADLVVDFGGGRGVFTHDANGWQWLSNMDDVNRMVVWDGDLVVDFGAGRGMHSRGDAGWQWLSNWDDVAEIVPWFDGTEEKLGVDFGPGTGIYYTDGAGWNWTINWSTSD